MAGSSDKKHFYSQMACQEKNCPPKSFYPRIKFFSDCVKNVCPILKIFVHLASQTMSGSVFLNVFNVAGCM